MWLISRVGAGVRHKIGHDAGIAEDQQSITSGVDAKLAEEIIVNREIYRSRGGLMQTGQEYIALLPERRAKSLPDDDDECDSKGAAPDANYGDSTFGQPNLLQSNVGRSLQYAAKLIF